MNTTQSINGSPVMTWFKSSYSGTSGGDCVEVAMTPGSVHVRDSKDMPGPRIVLGPVAWTDFLRFAVKR
jgi:hypothetical protein